MRPLALCLMLVVLPLAACDSKAPPAAPAAEKPAAAVPAVTTPAAPAKTAAVPADAAPMFGTWASDLTQCGSAAATVTIAAASYAAGGKSCDLTLTANGDGSFTGACGGQNMKMTPVFAPTGEGVNLVFADGKKQTVLRCGR